MTTGAHGRSQFLGKVIDKIIDSCFVAFGQLGFIGQVGILSLGLMIGLPIGNVGSRKESNVLGSLSMFEVVCNEAGILEHGNGIVLNVDHHHSSRLIMKGIDQVITPFVSEVRHFHKGQVLIIDIGEDGMGVGVETTVLQHCCHVSRCCHDERSLQRLSCSCCSDSFLISLQYVA